MVLTYRHFATDHQQGHERDAAEHAIDPQVDPPTPGRPLQRRLPGVMAGIGGAEPGMLEHCAIELDHVDVVSRDLLRHADQSSSGGRLPWLSQQQISPSPMRNPRWTAVTALRWLPRRPPPRARSF